ncbi:hypothetical protein JNJ66_03630 [Candidatus Saccharibacteria bacterium]|nr:hypothetical protein [Candidatus Saccharibacteria bacterium]
MTANPDAIVALDPAPEACLTPQVVNLEFHGSTITVTLLLNDLYYTLERVRPDFPALAGQRLEMPGQNVDEVCSRLRNRYHDVSKASLDGRSERHIIGELLAEDIAFFDKVLAAFLDSNCMTDLKPSDRRYYDLVKSYAAAWQRVAQLIAGE